MDSSTRSNIIMRMPNGLVVELLSIEGEWAKVRVNTLEGYMLACYLEER